MNPHEQVSPYRCVTYRPNDPESEALLEHYLATTDIENNKTRKQLRVDRYDGVAGALFMLVHQETSSVDGITSCVRYDEDGIVSAKVWHRLHIKPHVPSTSMDRFFEPATFHWCEQQGIDRLWVTFNESSPRTCEWAATKMGERRNAKRPNAFTQGYGQNIRSAWRPHGKLIYERNTWQYVIFYSPDGQFFLKREEKSLDKVIQDIFKNEFPTATKDWV